MSQSPHPLEYAEYAAAAGAGIGLVTAIFTSNWLLAMIPLALTLILGVYNRYRAEQQYRRRFMKISQDAQLQYDQLQQEIVQSRSFATALVKQTFATQKAELPSATGDPLNLQVLEKQVVDQQRLMTSYQNHLMGVEGTMNNLAEALDAAAIPDRVEYLEQAIVKLSKQAGIDPAEVLPTPGNLKNQAPPEMFSLDDLGLDDMGLESMGLTEPEPSLDFDPPTPTRLQGMNSGFITSVVSPKDSPSIDKIAADLISGDLLGSDPISGDLISGDLESGDLWERPAWDLLATLKAHTDWVRCLSFTPDSQTLVSGSFDQSIKLWNLSSKLLIHDLKDHHKGVFALAVSANGQMLASGSWDETIKLWDIQTGTLIRNLDGHSASVRSLVMSPDNDHLISGSFDNSIRIWQLASGDLLKTMNQSEPIAAIALNHTGQILASTGDDGLVKLWSVSTGEIIAELSGNSGCICSLAISPTSDVIVAGTVGGSLVSWAMNPQHIQSGEPLQKFKAHSGQINSCVFHPNGQYLVTGSVDGKARIWAQDSQNKFREKPRKTLRGEPGRSVMSAAISANGKYIAIGGADGSIELWQS